MNIGSVRMTERHLLDDPPGQAQIGQALEDVDSWIDRAFDKVPVAGVGSVIGVSGTVTTMSALALGCQVYDRHAVDGQSISVEAARRVDDKVLNMSRQERRGLKTIHPGRVDVIGGGALIWNRLLERLGHASPSALASGTYVASEHGLLDGLVMDYGRTLLRE